MNRQTIIEKIKKLKSLSKGSSYKGEANTASLMANKLIKKYNIDIDELELYESSDDIIEVYEARPQQGKVKYWELLFYFNLPPHIIILPLPEKSTNTIILRCLNGTKADMELAKKICSNIFNTWEFAKKYIRQWNKLVSKDRKINLKGNNFINWYFITLISLTRDLIWEQFEKPILLDYEKNGSDIEEQSEEDNRIINQMTPEHNSSKFPLRKTIKEPDDDAIALAKYVSMFITRDFLSGVFVIK